jgi:GNAT superfamily N-acetyltransferase
MQSTVEYDPVRFLPQVKPFLVNRRMENTMFISVLNYWITDESPNVAKVGAYVQDSGGAVVGVAINQQGARVMLSSMSIDAVTGPPQVARSFAERRGARLGRPWRRNSRVGMYVAGDGLMPAVRGLARPINEDDLPLLTEWLSVFYSAEDKWKGTARAHHVLRHGVGYIWEVDGTPVAFSGCAGELWGVSNHGPWYTVPEHRGVRYGRAVGRVAIEAARERGIDVITNWINLEDPSFKRILENVKIIDESHDYTLLAET